MEVSFKPTTVTVKRYQCTHCGHESKQSTNHYGETYSWGRVNRCDGCGWRRPMDVTVWRCLEVAPGPENVPEPWRVTE